MTDNLESKLNGKTHILVVDDDKILAKISKRMIESESHGKYEAHIAMDGKEATEMLSKHNYPIVISDIDMPRMNGFQLYEWAMANLSLKPKFIFISGNMDEDRTQNLDKKGIPYLPKPFRVEDYMSLIEDNLSENSKR